MESIRIQIRTPQFFPSPRVAVVVRAFLVGRKAASSILAVAILVFEADVSPGIRRRVSWTALLSARVSEKAGYRTPPEPLVPRRVAEYGNAVVDDGIG